MPFKDFLTSTLQLGTRPPYSA